MCIGKEMRNIVLHDSNHRPSGRAVKRRDDWKNLSGFGNHTKRLLRFLIFVVKSRSPCWKPAQWAALTRPHGTGYMIKQKPPEGGMGILLDGKQGDIIEIFCAEYTADLTRDRISSIVKGLRHTAGILRGHQILHHIADGSARRKFVFRDGERHTEKSSIYQQPPLPICEKFLIDCASRGGWFYVCGTNTFC